MGVCVCVGVCVCLAQIFSEEIGKFTSSKFLYYQTFTQCCVDPHSVFPDPAVFLNADLDPALKLCLNDLMKSSLVKKKIAQKEETMRLVLISVKNQKIVQKKETMGLVIIYFKNWNFLASFCFYLKVFPS